LSKDTANFQQHCLTPPENAAIIDRLYDVDLKEIKLARQVIWLQIAITMVGASLAYDMREAPQTIIAVLCGGMIATVNGAMLAWKMSRSALPAQNLEDPRAAQQQLRFLYLAAAERYLAVTALLGLCMLALKLTPLALLGGFVLGQATLIVARLLLNRI
jgi:ATP synthase protein I